MKLKLSVVMITWNEAANITRSLESVAFADEIIVVDRLSDDDTVAVAKACGATVIEHAWQGFGKQKNIAIDHATGDWILSLDADEVVSPATAQAIQAAMDDPSHDAWYLPRRAWFLGRWIMHGDWYPDWQLRLFKKEATRFSDAAIHERVKPTARTGYLKTAVLDHYSYKDLSDYLVRLDQYTSLEADLRYKHGFSLVRLLLKPGYRFMKQYVFGAGFLDGLAGFIVAVLSATYVFITEIKVLERRLATPS